MRLGKWEELTKLKEVISGRADALNLDVLRNGKYSVSVDKGNTRYVFGTYTTYRSADRIWEWLADYVNPYETHNAVIDYHHIARK